MIVRKILATIAVALLILCFLFICWMLVSGLGAEWQTG